MRRGDFLQGDISSPILGSQTADTFVLHRLVGGLTSGGGGKFASGFLAAGVGSLADGFEMTGGSPTPPSPSTSPNTPCSWRLRSPSSAEASSQQGAETGAFGYLFQLLRACPVPVKPGPAAREELFKTDTGLTDETTDPLHEQAAREVEARHNAVDFSLDIADLGTDGFPHALKEAWDALKDTYDAITGAREEFDTAKEVDEQFRYDLGQAEDEYNTQRALEQNILIHGGNGVLIPNPDVYGGPPG